MRTIRNVVFVAMLVVVGFAMRTNVEACCWYSTFVTEYSCDAWTWDHSVTATCDYDLENHFFCEDAMTAAEDYCSDSFSEPVRGFACYDTQGYVSWNCGIIIEGRKDAIR